MAINIKKEIETKHRNEVIENIVALVAIFLASFLLIAMFLYLAGK